jgi:hypothetical protein
LAQMQKAIVYEYIHDYALQSGKKVTEVCTLGGTAEYLIPPANTRTNFIVLGFSMARCVELRLSTELTIVATDLMGNSREMPEEIRQTIRHS